MWHIAAWAANWIKIQQWGYSTLPHLTPHTIVWLGGVSLMVQVWYIKPKFDQPFSANKTNLLRILHNNLGCLAVENCLFWIVSCCASVRSVSRWREVESTNCFWSLWRPGPTQLCVVVLWKYVNVNSLQHTTLGWPGFSRKLMIRDYYWSIYE